KSAKRCEVMRCASSSARAIGPPLCTSRQCPAALPAGTAWATAVERSRRWASAAGRSLDVTRLGHSYSISYSGVIGEAFDELVALLTPWRKAIIAGHGYPGRTFVERQGERAKQADQQAKPGQMDGTCSRRRWLLMV